MGSLKGQGYAIGASLVAAVGVVLLLWSESISTRIEPKPQTGATVATHNMAAGRATRGLCHGACRTGTP
jgi:hypothetical protein